MTWRQINAPNDYFHWVNDSLANDWLDRVIALSNPDPAPGKARAFLTSQAANYDVQIEAVRQTFKGLEYFYRAVNLPAFDEPIYKREFEAAYGTQIRWEENSAFGTAKAGWMMRDSIDAIKDFGRYSANPSVNQTADYLENNISWYLIRASVRPDTSASGVFCGRILSCQDVDDTYIRLPVAWNREVTLSGKDCSSWNDWRCVGWQNGGKVVSPALVWSMNLAYVIANKLKYETPEGVVLAATQARARRLTITESITRENPPKFIIPQPPVLGSPGDILTSPLGATPVADSVVMPPAPVPPTVQPPSYGNLVGARTGATSLRPPPPRPIFDPVAPMPSPVPTPPVPTPPVPMPPVPTPPVPPPVPMPPVPTPPAPMPPAPTPTPDFTPIPVESSVAASGDNFWVATAVAAVALGYFFYTKSKKEQAA